MDILKILRSIALLVLLLSSWPEITLGDENKVNALYPALQNGNWNIIEGREYKTFEDVGSIFAVPVPNTVGTNYLDNAISLVEFSNDIGIVKKLRKDFLRYVFTGKHIYMPLFSKGVIGYAQNRSFLLFNIKEKTFSHWIICKLMQQMIDEVVVVNAEQNIFMFKISAMLGLGKEKMLLQLVDLKGEDPVLLANFSVPDKDYEGLFGKIVFLYDDIKLQALDEKFQPISHPLLIFYNNKPELFGELYPPFIHPTLPFALVLEDNPAVAENLIFWLVSWQDDPNHPKWVKIFDDNLIGYLQWSPDGKWLLFTDSTQKPKKYFAMPVNLDLPHFLGPPVHLKGEVSRNPEYRSAWVTDPLGYAISLEKKLIKWDFPNAR